MKAPAKRIIGCFAVATVAVLFLIGGCFVVGSGPVGNSQALTRFQRHICPSVPASLTNLTLSGHSGLGGATLNFRFNLASNDFAALIENGGFAPVELRKPNGRGWLSNAMAQLANPAVFSKHQDEPYYSVTLVADTNRTTVLAHCFRP